MDYVIRFTEQAQIEDPRFTERVTEGDVRAVIDVPLLWITRNCPQPRELVPTAAVSGIAREHIDCAIQTALQIPMESIVPKRHVQRVFEFDVTLMPYGYRSRRHSFFDDLDLVDLDPPIPIVLCAPPAMQAALQALANLVSDYLHLPNLPYNPQNTEWANRAGRLIPVLAEASVGHLSRAELAFLLHLLDSMRNKAMQGRIWPEPSPLRRYAPVIACGLLLLAFGLALIWGAMVLP